MALPTVPEPGLDSILSHYGDFIDNSVEPYIAELYRVSTLDEKTKELVVTALLALRGWRTGVRVHARHAVDAGATPDEVRGAILITMGIGGMAAAAEALTWADEVLS
jgi:alkylhydroperoxidase/carboxymuconolactone decarboxylase family protein YurZ